MIMIIIIDITVKRGFIQISPPMPTV